MDTLTRNTREINLVLIFNSYLFCNYLYNWSRWFIYTNKRVRACSYSNRYSHRSFNIWLFNWYSDQRSTGNGWRRFRFKEVIGYPDNIHEKKRCFNEFIKKDIRKPKILVEFITKHGNQRLMVLRRNAFNFEIGVKFRN
jgi:hypothetical protein